MQESLLPDENQQFTGTAKVSGWGTLHSNGPHPDILQVVEVPLVSDVGMLKGREFNHIKYI